MKKILLVALMALCGVSFGFGAVNGDRVILEDCEERTNIDCIKNNCVEENGYITSKCRKNCENIAKAACER